MAALPGIALVLIYLGFSGSRTLALGKSWLLVFVLSAFFTEVSSAFSAFNFTSLIIAWLCICGLAFIRFLFSSKKKFSAPFLPDREELMLLAGIGIIQLITLIIAVSAAPNNWDSMTYHLSRVAHWADQHSVAHFFTAIDRQISQPPGAEFLIAQLYILEGTDKWANLVQWTSGLVALAAVYRIGLFLGESKKVGLWSVFIAGLVPMFILQSSSTQNDLVVASFLLWTMAFALESLKRSNLKSISTLHWAGLAFAAAVLTKGTALVFGIPIFVLLLFKTWRRFRTKIVFPAATALLFLLLLNGPHWTRNFQEFNSPLGPAYGLANKPIAGPAILLNTTKNLTHQLRSPANAVNTLMERAVHGVHSVLGFDVNQGALHWSGSPGYSLTYQGKNSYLHEDYGPGPMHILFFLIALVWIGLKGDRNWKIYAVFCFCLILIFSAVLKWQIWHARLLLPFYLFISPLIAWLFLRIPKWPAAILFFLCAIPFLIQNHSRPLVGQTSILRTTKWEQ
ncbi:MAG: 4-amino-4-deoxy-L-arabinose transferase-like glycosyltransferase, partial [Limisphaerales bacterium]